MDIRQAIDRLREHSMVCFDRVTNNLITGGERFEHLDDIDTDLITGNLFSIYLKDGWWIADFGNNAIAQITNDLSTAVQSICDVFKYDTQKPKGYRTGITNTLGILQAAHLPVLVVDYGVLEIYQAPQEPKGLSGLYGNFLTDWWLPGDSPTTPIGKILLENDIWFIEQLGKNELIPSNTLEEATQKALNLFK